MFTVCETFLGASDMRWPWSHLGALNLAAKRLTHKHQPCKVSLQVPANDETKPQGE